MNNVLFIMTDQWRYECFGYKGHPIVKTPNVDFIAGKSFVFENAHTITPLCSPARGCLMTGKLPHVNGVTDNYSTGYARQPVLSPDLYTFLDSARDNGFRTGYFGKWHLGVETLEGKGIAVGAKDGFRKKDPPQGPATARGELLPGARQMYGATKKHPGDNPPFYALADKIEDLREYRIKEETCAFLANGDKDKPWFAMASFPGPHFPHTIPEPYHSMYNYTKMPLPKSIGDRFLNKPWFQNRHWWPSMETDNLTDTDWQKTTAAYYGFISLVDDLIGELLQTARQNANGRGVTVVFCADHGEMLGNHSRFDKGGYFYEDVMRIPLLISEDIFADNAARRDIAQYCGIQDLSKTTFGLTGHPIPQGRDLLKLAKGNSTDNWPEVAYGAYYKYNGHTMEVRCIATPRYKYSFVPQDIDELYDLETDPLEMNNLSDRDEYADIKAELKEKVLAWMRENDDYLLDRLDNLPPAGTIVG